MRTQRRVASMVILLATVVAFAQPAQAALISEGYSQGGRASTVSGNLTLRRPGLPSGAIFDTKLGGRDVLNSGTRAYIGIRTLSDGRIQCIAQYAVNGRNVTVPGPINTAASKTQDSTAIVTGSSTVYVDFQCNFRTTRSAPVQFDQVIVRALSTSNNMVLGRTEARDLAYGSNNGLGVVPWGMPSLKFLDPPNNPSKVCGDFPVADRYYYSFNDPARCFSPGVLV